MSSILTNNILTKYHIVDIKIHISKSSKDSKICSQLTWVRLGEYISIYELSET